MPDDLCRRWRDDVSNGEGKYGTIKVLDVDCRTAQGVRQGQTDVVHEVVAIPPEGWVGFLINHEDNVPWYDARPIIPCEACRMESE